MEEMVSVAAGKDDKEKDDEVLPVNTYCGKKHVGAGDHASTNSQKQKSYEENRDKTNQDLAGHSKTNGICDQSYDTTAEINPWKSFLRLKRRHSQCWSDGFVDEFLLLLLNK